LTDDLDPEVKSASAYLLSHAHAYEAVLTMARNVDQLSKLDQLIAERQASVDAATALLEKATKATEAKTAELVEVQAKVTDASRRADNIIATAKISAAEIVADANRMRDETAAGAKAQGEQIIADLKAANADLDAELEGKRKWIADLQAAGDAAEAQATAAEARVASAKAFLADLAKS
jgi:hypothetical protein